MRNRNRLNTIDAMLATLETELASTQAHYDASYEDALAAEMAGDIKATERHGEWLAHFDAALVSLRASRHMLQVEYNALLVMTEAA